MSNKGSWSDDDVGDDNADHAHHGDDDPSEKKGEEEAKTNGKYSYDKSVVSVLAEDLIAMEIPQRAMLLDPVIPGQGLVMIHAKRGVGKTHVSLSMACAIAAGSELFEWKAPEPAGVLFVDGEMPASLLKERLKLAIAALPGDAKLKAPLVLITPDIQNPESPIPDLATVDGQAAITEHITPNIKCIVLDNLSTLIRSGNENEAESWQLFQDWILWLRARGLTVILVHHSGKSGEQRGTSRREDALDTVINLTHPKDYQSEEGARFNVSIEKARHYHGPSIRSFEATMKITTTGKAKWTKKLLQDKIREEIEELLLQGYSYAQISAELGVPKSTVQYHGKKIKDREKGGE